jgi:hypothetical protein
MPGLFCQASTQEKQQEYRKNTKQGPNGRKTGLTRNTEKNKIIPIEYKSCDEDGQGFVSHREPAVGESRRMQPDAYPFRAEKANAQRQVVFSVTAA